MWVSAYLEGKQIGIRCTVTLDMIWHASSQLCPAQFIFDHHWGGVQSHRWPQITGGHFLLPASLFKHISFHKVMKVIALYGSFKEAFICLHKCLSGFILSVQKLIFRCKKTTGSKSGRRMN